MKEYLWFVFAWIFACCVARIQKKVKLPHVRTRFSPKIQAEYKYLVVLAWLFSILSLLCFFWAWGTRVDTVGSDTEMNYKYQEQGERASENPQREQLNISGG